MYGVHIFTTITFTITVESDLSHDHVLHSVQRASSETEYVFLKTAFRVLIIL